jgi:hypothetical protein
MRIDCDELDNAISPTDPSNESVLVYRNGSPLGVHPIISDDDSSSLRRTKGGKEVKEISLFKNMKASSKQASYGELPKINKQSKN